jgi:hypothetical protein
MEFELKYQRNTGWNAWPPHETSDPGRLFKSVTMYVSKMVGRCKIAEWRMETNQFDTDVDASASVTMPARTLSDEQLNCLVDFVRPPYVTLKRITS